MAITHALVADGDPLVAAVDWNADHVGVLDTVWPIGSVFIAVVSTNPATLLGGGTWSAFGAGRVMVGLDSSDTDFDTVEETGGAKTVTLTAAQSGLPQHTHTQDAHNHQMFHRQSVLIGGASGECARFARAGRKPHNLWRVLSRQFLRKMSQC